MKEWPVKEKIQRNAVELIYSYYLYTGHLTDKYKNTLKNKWPVFTNK